MNERLQNTDPRICTLCRGAGKELTLLSCGFCKGTGSDSEDPEKPCLVCFGVANWDMPTSTDCPGCKGHGTVKGPNAVLD